MKPIKNLWLFNENKLRILAALYFCQDNVCGCDLIEKLNIPKNLLSYHIKILREEKIIEEVKCGVRKNYSICRDKQQFIKHVLQTVELI